MILGIITSLLLVWLGASLVIIFTLIAAYGSVRNELTDLQTALAELTESRQMANLMSGMYSTGTKPPNC